MVKMGVLFLLGELAKFAYLTRPQRRKAKRNAAKAVRDGAKVDRDAAKLAKRQAKIDKMPNVTLQDSAARANAWLFGMAEFDKTK